MWHIPINVGEHSLLYAAETFEQFEAMLQFFEKPDNEENNVWCDKLANDIGTPEKSDNSFGLEDYNDEQDSKEEYLEDSQTTVKEQQSTLRGNVVTMKTTTINCLETAVSFEVEQDMRVRAQKVDKVDRVQDYVESIAARFPLLGTAVIEEGSRKAVELKALRGIKILLKHHKVCNWVYLAVFLTVIQYAKSWEGAKSSGFWSYICEQFGYKYSQQIYDVLTTSVKEACRSYKRLFVVCSNGDNRVSVK